jgi:phosphohistidine phosphatase
MKQLLICRHAKSSWKDTSLADFDRPLNKRGKRDAPRMGKMLASNKIEPDLIVSSPAKRARQTATILAKELEFPKKKLSYMEAIYEASPEVLIDCIRSFDDRFDQAIIVGHNSGFTILANLLGNLQIPNVPTCGIVALDFAVRSWKEVKKKEGELLFFYYPKMLPVDSTHPLGL